MRACGTAGERLHHSLGRGGMCGTAGERLHHSAGEGCAALQENGSTTRPGRDVRHCRRTTPPLPRPGRDVRHCRRTTPPLGRGGMCGTAGERLHHSAGEGCAALQENDSTTRPGRDVRACGTAGERLYHSAGEGCAALQENDSTTLRCCAAFFFVFFCVPQLCLCGSAFWLRFLRFLLIHPLR